MRCQQICIHLIKKEDEVCQHGNRYSEDLRLVSNWVKVYSLSDPPDVGKEDIPWDRRHRNITPAQDEKEDDNSNKITQ